jgi:hypothetical protein
MTRSEKGLHNATGHAMGARETAFSSDDGPVDLRVSGPCTPAGGRTNQIFARRLGYLLSTPGLRPATTIELTPGGAAVVLENHSIS